MSVAIRAITRLRDADDAAFFAGQGWLNVRDYGAVGNGVTDDTTAIQAAITAAGAAGGGTIFFPAGTYIVGGALQDVSGANAQLVLPSVTTPIGPGYTIRLIGPTPPVAHYWYPDSSTAVPTDGAIIKSTLGSGTGALLGGYNNNAEPNDFTYISLAIRNMRFRMPANPTNSCLDLMRVACVDLAHVVVDAGEYDTSQIAQPTTATSYGIKMPMYNNGASVAADWVTVIGFYTGMLIGEHQTGDQLHVAACYYAYEFPFVYHATHFGRVLYQNCKSGLRFTGGAHYTTIGLLDIERTNDGAKWYSMTSDIVDASNLGYGTLNYHVVLSGTGVVTTFNVSGGANLTYSRLGTVPKGSITVAEEDGTPNVAGVSTITVSSGSLTDDTGGAVSVVTGSGGTPPTISSAEVGTVDASTVVVTFNESVKAANYATGVTINVNGSPATISSATRQSNKAIVYYAIASPVASGETVTLDYVAADGFITDAAGAHLANVSAQSVTNNIAGASDLLTGLVGWWELSEASGTRADSTANNLDLTDNATVTQAVGVGGVGNAAQFTAANSEYLSRASEASLVMGDTDFTVAAWVYLDSKSADMYAVQKAGNDGIYEYVIDYNQSTDRFRFWAYTATPTEQPIVSANDFGAVSTGTWYLVIAWNNQTGDTVNICVNNGTVTSAAKGSNVFITSTKIFQIGAAVGAGYFNGRIAKAGLWTKVLSADERTELYNAGAGATYPFS